MILAKTFATIIGDLSREDLVFEYFTAELKEDRNDVEQIVVIVVFDSTDECVDDPFDNRLTIEKTLIEQHAQESIVIIPLTTCFLVREIRRWRCMMRLRCQWSIVWCDRTGADRQAMSITRQIRQMIAGHVRNGRRTLAERVFFG